MLTFKIELAAALPDVWDEPFESEEEAALRLASDRDEARKLAAAVDLALRAAERRAEREGKYELTAWTKSDVWARISRADLLFLVSHKPRKVAAAYREAIKDIPDFDFASVRKQLLLYKGLGLLEENLAEAVKVVGNLEDEEGESSEAARPRKGVLLFAGHMVDAPGREEPRFPADKEGVARERIRESVVKELESGAGVVSGYAGGASGGDILFHEVCAELNIPTRLYLAVPPQDYVKKSVRQAGQQWVDRFWKLYNERSAQKQVRVMSDATDVGDEREYLPAWLREKPGYKIWQRNNL
jgi:hypothetical protein